MDKRIKKHKLNVGCGNDIKPGYINTDLVMRPGVDVVCDINKKLPFKDNQFDEILLISVLEYSTDLYKTMSEIYRVAKPNAIIKIKVPYRHSFFPEMTAFYTKSFDVFTKNYLYSNNVCGTKFEIIEKKAIPTTFGRLIPPLPFFKWIALDFRHYLSYFLTNIIAQIYFELRVIK